MTFQQAVQAAQSGQPVTRPGRANHYLTFHESAGLILNGDGVPCRWAPLAGDVEAVDWLIASGEATVAITQPSRGTCPYCGGPAVAPCPRCRHALICAAISGLAGNWADGAVARTAISIADAIIAARELPQDMRESIQAALAGALGQAAR